MQLEEENITLQQQFDVAKAQQNALQIAEFLNEQNISDVVELIYDNIDDAAPIIANMSIHRASAVFKLLDTPTQKQIIQELPHNKTAELLNDLPGNQVLLDHFLQGAIEAESDSICDGKDVYTIGMMEHIEPAGIHSGDSYAVLPTFDLSENVLKQMEEYTKTIAVALNTVGLLNIQFAIKDEVVYIIEANPRASRTVPFIAKAYDEPYVNYATKVMLGAKVKDFDFKPKKKGYAIKIPVFSYEKFPEIQKELGPEMKSTGEAIYFIDDLYDEYFQNIYSERNLYLSK